MPKAKKPRKKPNHQAALKARVNKALKNMWLADGDVMPKMMLQPYDKANMSVNKRFDVDPDLILSALKYRKMNWQYVKLVFCVDSFGKRYINREYTTMNKPQSVHQMQKSGIMLFDKLLEQQNKNHVQSVGYVACPDKDVDIDDLIDHLLPQFESRGCFDMQQANNNIKNRDWSAAPDYGDSRGNYA